MFQVTSVDAAIAAPYASPAKGFRSNGPGKVQSSKRAAVSNGSFRLTRCLRRVGTG